MRWDNLAPLSDERREALSSAGLWLTDEPVFVITKDWRPPSLPAAQKRGWAELAVQSRAEDRK